MTKNILITLTRNGSKGFVVQNICQEIFKMKKSLKLFTRTLNQAGRLFQIFSTFFPSSRVRNIFFKINYVKQWFCISWRKNCFSPTQTVFLSFFFPLLMENYASLEPKILQKSEKTKCKNRILKPFLILKFSPHETFCPGRCS